MSAALHAILQHPDFPQGQAWSEQEYSPQQSILVEGETSRYLYLILSGTVRVNMRVTVEDGREMDSGLTELTHGETFGELNLFQDAHRTASVVALSSVKLVRIDGKALSAFMDAHPELGYPVLKDYFMQHAALLRSVNLKVGSLYAQRLQQL